MISVVIFLLSNIVFIKTLIHRASNICQPQVLRQELQHLDWTLQANCCMQQEIKRSMYLNWTTASALALFTNASTAFLPYMGKITDRIGRILRMIKTIYKPTIKVLQLLSSLKGPRALLLRLGCIGYLAHADWCAWELRNAHASLSSITDRKVGRGRTCPLLDENHMA